MPIGQNAPNTVLRGFIGVTVTLAVANTKYNLLTLINAVLAAETQGDNTARCLGMCRSVVIQSNPGIDSSGANTNDVLVGDGLLSATRVGYVLGLGGIFTDRSPINNVNIGDIYVQSAGTAQKLNVNVVAG